MKTLEDEQPTTTSYNQRSDAYELQTKTLEHDDEQLMEAGKRPARKATISLPCEIIEDILSRLPVKSILRFRSVSKPWLSLISNPSFTKLHFSRPHRTNLFISAYDESTSKLHLLSAPYTGGPLTQLVTLDDACYISITEAEHLNGLVCFICKRWLSRFNWAHAYAFVLNPSTHKIFELPDPYLHTHVKGYVHYFFGFDESINQHKILMIKELLEPTKFEIMIFCMSNYSWRKIDVEPPIGFTWDDLSIDSRSVCVNSVVHMALADSLRIVAFDLRTEKLSMLNTPQVLSYDDVGDIGGPYITKINGCVGIVCCGRVVESNEMHIWILKDYENHVWVREIITFPPSWVELDQPFPIDSVNPDEIIFTNMDEVIVSASKFLGNMVSVFVYNKKSKSFKSFQFTLGPQFPTYKTLELNQIRSYVESMVPL